MNTTSKLIKLYSKYIEQLQFNRLRFLTRSTASLIIVGNEKKAFNRKITTKIKMKKIIILAHLLSATLKYYHRYDHSS